MFSRNAAQKGQRPSTLWSTCACVHSQVSKAASQPWLRAGARSSSRILRLDEHTMGEEIMVQVSLHARTHAHARTSHSGRVLIGTRTKIRAEEAMASLAKTVPEEYVRIMGLSAHTDDGPTGLLFRRFQAALVAASRIATPKGAHCMGTPDTTPKCTNVLSRGRQCQDCKMRYLATWEKLKEREFSAWRAHEGATKQQGSGPA